MSEPRTPEQWIEQFRKEIADHHVMVYAKGEKHAAVCGFSHRVMEILDRAGTDYAVRNVLTDPVLLDTLCDFTNWPTTPQIFIGGEFVGGCDILSEMEESGELGKLLAKG